MKTWFKTAVFLSLIAIKPQQSVAQMKLIASQTQSDELKARVQRQQLERTYGVETVKHVGHVFGKAWGQRRPLPESRTAQTGQQKTKSFSFVNGGSAKPN